jgi:hypothetical protein
MKWSTLLRIVGMACMIAAYALFLVEGQSVEVLGLVLMSITALISPEAISRMARGPNK